MGMGREMDMKKQAANILTGLRIIGSVLLVCLPTFSLRFYIIYLLCGFTDMIDGTVARKTNSTSRFGEKLDTAADIVFVAAALIKFLPNLPIPLWLWIWGGGIAVIKIGNILWGYIARKQFIVLHSILNKVTGLLLFILPLTQPIVEFRYSSIAVCFIATCSAVQEAVCIATGCGNRTISGDSLPI